MVHLFAYLPGWDLNSASSPLPKEYVDCYQAPSYHE